jgi:DNA-binding response OmpR family regulator
MRVARALDVPSPMPAVPRFVPIAPGSPGSGTYPRARGTPVPIVVLDFDRHTLAGLSRSLVDFAVHTATNPAEALALVEQVRPRVIVCSVAFAPLELVYFTRTLRARYGRAIPVLMMTQAGHTQHVMLALQLGARAVVEKPINVEKLRSAVLKHAG